LGTDGVVAGHVVDAWIDRTETIVRYLEVELDPALGVGRVLLPMPFVELNRRLGEIHVAALLGSNFAEVPRLRNPNQVTLREEDRISAYYGGGMLYATPARLGPVL
jgi:photosynthetic reaction center H subunit